MMHKGIFSAFAVTALLSAAAVFSAEASARETGQAGDGEKTVRQWGIIDFSVSNLRKAPDYESALETQELMGTVVEIIGEQGYWLQVRTPQPYTAWCTDMGVHRADEAEIEDWISSRRYIVTSPHSAIYSDRTNRSDVVCDLVEGDIVRAVLGKPQPRVRCYGLPIRRDGWAKVQTPSGKTGWVRTADVRDFYKWAAQNTVTEKAVKGKAVKGKVVKGKAMTGKAVTDKSAKKKPSKKKKEKRSEETGYEAMGKAVVETAMRFVGTPYLWGGMSPNGFDCSGLVRFAYFMNGLMLPRNADQMALCGRPVPVFRAEEAAACSGDGAKKSVTCDGCGAAEERTFCADSLKAGDLLFFGRRGTDWTQDRIAHVGLYIGDGRMVHSSQIVRVSSLVPGEPDFYENAGRLLSAVRIIGYEKDTRDDLFKTGRVSDSIHYFR